MIHLTTFYQDKVLNILRSNGRIVSHYENDKWNNSLVEECLNSHAIRNDTIAKLEKLKFIKENLDYPALGINTWVITKKGIEWLETNKIELWNPF